MSSSLTRKASKGILRTVEDFSASLEQKNNIIAVLKTEVQNLRPNQENYDRIKEELNRAKNRYESVLRDHQRSVTNNQQRLELSSRSVYELRMQSQHLQDELRLQSQALKEAKFTSQQLVDFQNRKADEATQIVIKFQEQKSLNEVRKLQEERTRLQIAQVREQVQKGERESNLIRNQSQSLNQKCYKTQNYMRSLLREEANLNENLSRVELENDRIDTSISELDTVVSINNGQIANKDKDCQELQFHIANKELERKKIQNQIREKVKQLSAEKEKWRGLSQQVEQKKMEASRMEAQVCQASTEITFIMGKNNEIIEVNNQLNDDLKVCQRHLQNVCRVNKNMQGQIQCLKQTNLRAISKLQIPLGKSNTSNNAVNSSGGKWGVTSRVTNFESGDFQKRTSR